MKELVTVAEAAKRLSLGRSKLYEYVLSGRLQSIKLGRSRRIPVAAIETFVAELVRDQSTDFA